MTENNIKFSVIMPCYNSEQYVKKAIDSILNQTYGNWELIAVNDGSADSTPEILAEASLKDSRIKVFTKENGGYVSAVNCGMQNISGDYFMFLGSDDYLNHTLFESAAQNIGSSLPDCIAFKTEKILNNKSIGTDSYTSFDTFAQLSDTTLKKYREKYPEHSQIFCVRDTSRFYRAQTLKNLTYYGKTGFDADGIFSMLFCHNSSSFMSIPVTGYYWVLREDSVSGRTPSEKTNLDRLNNWQYFYNEINSISDDEVTDDEKNYIIYYAQIITLISKNINDYRKNKAVIIDHRKNVLRLLKKYNYYKKCGLIMKFFLFSPALYAVFYGIIKKIVDR